LAGNWRVTAFGCGSVDGTSTPDRIADAVRTLSGQRLVAAAIAPLTAITTLRFDLGAELVLWPGEDADVWTLYDHDRSAVTLHADGSFSTEPLARESGTSA
jgi:hypothetical protein